MAEQSIDAQIADLQEQIDKLEAKKKALANPPQEYPKYVLLPETDEAKKAREAENVERLKRGDVAVPPPSKVVNSAEEEKGDSKAKKDEHEDKPDTRADRSRGR